MNQRQKKKSSQQRKRHFDGVKARESGQPSGTQKQHSKEQAKPHPVPTAQPQSNKVHARDVAPVATSPVESNVPPRDQRRNFSKRKVVSNWAKYDEERLDEIDSTSHQENEEALQDRLLQLFNLPITHTIPSLADIGDINQGSIGNAAQEELAEGSDFLTLDCRALAEALSTLPLHQRLDIDHELFTDENREGGMVSYSDSDSSQPATSSSRASLHKYKNVVFRRAGHEEDELDLTKSLKKYSDKKDDVRIECQYHVDFSLVESLKQTVASVKSVEASTEGSRQSASADDEEIELDKLLSRKMEAKPHSPKPGGLLKSKDDPQSSSNVATEIKSHAPTTVEDENTELDDMLDELLT